MKIIIILYVGIYLTIMSIWDLRRREIPMLPGLISVLLVCVGQICTGTSWKSWVMGALIGVIIYMVGRLSRGGVGTGDALVYVITGLCLGLARNLDILALSLFMAAMVGVTLLIFGKVGKKYAMPFIPFTAIAYGLVVVYEISETGGIV